MERTDFEPSFVDFWPLTVQYFNLQLLEFQAIGRFRPRFSKLFSSYPTASDLLRKYPEYIGSKRYLEVQRVVEFATRSL